MIEKAKELLAKHGCLSISFLCCKLHCTRGKAIEIINSLCKPEKMDHTLPLNDFIEKYRSRMQPLRKIRQKGKNDDME